MTEITVVKSNSYTASELAVMPMKDLENLYTNKMKTLMVFVTSLNERIDSEIDEAIAKIHEKYDAENEKLQLKLDETEIIERVIEARVLGGEKSSVTNIETIREENDRRIADSEGCDGDCENCYDYDECDDICKQPLSIVRSKDCYKTRFGRCHGCVGAEDCVDYDGT